MKINLFKIFVALCSLLLPLLYGCSPNFFTRLAKRYEPYNFTEKSEIKTYNDTTGKFGIYKSDTTIINFNTPQQKTQIIYVPVKSDSSIINVYAYPENDTIVKRAAIMQKEEKDGFWDKHQLIFIFIIGVFLGLLILKFNK